MDFESALPNATSLSGSSRGDTQVKLTAEQASKSAASSIAPETVENALSTSSTKAMLNVTSAHSEAASSDQSTESQHAELAALSHNSNATDKGSRLVDKGSRSASKESQAASDSIVSDTPAQSKAQDTLGAEAISVGLGPASESLLEPDSAPQLSSSTHGESLTQDGSLSQDKPVSKAKAKGKSALKSDSKKTKSKSKAKAKTKSKSKVQGVSKAESIASELASASGGEAVSADDSEVKSKSKPEPESQLESQPETQNPLESASMVGATNFTNADSINATEGTNSTAAKDATVADSQLAASALILDLALTAQSQSQSQSRSKSQLQSQSESQFVSLSESSLHSEVKIKTEGKSQTNAGLKKVELESGGALDGAVGFNSNKAKIKAKAQSKAKANNAKTKSKTQSLEDNSNPALKKAQSQDLLETLDQSQVQSQAQIQAQEQASDLAATHGQIELFDEAKLASQSELTIDVSLGQALETTLGQLDESFGNADAEAETEAKAGMAADAVELGSLAGNVVGTLAKAGALAENTADVADKIVTATKAQARSVAETENESKALADAENATQALAEKASKAKFEIVTGTKTTSQTMVESEIETKSETRTETVASGTSGMAGSAGAIDTFGAVGTAGTVGAAEDVSVSETEFEMGGQAEPVAHTQAEVHAVAHAELAGQGLLYRADETGSLALTLESGKSGHALEAVQFVSPEEDLQVLMTQELNSQDLSGAQIQLPNVEEMVEPTTALMQNANAESKLQESNANLQADAMATGANLEGLNVQGNEDTQDMEFTFKNAQYAKPVGELRLNVDDTLTLKKLLPDYKRVSVENYIKCFAVYNNKILNPDFADYPENLAITPDLGKRETWLFCKRLWDTFFFGEDYTIEDFFPQKFKRRTVRILSFRYSAHGEIDDNKLYRLRPKYEALSHFSKRVLDIMRPYEILDFAPGDVVSPLVHPVPSKRFAEVPKEAATISKKLRRAVIPGQYQSQFANRSDGWGPAYAQGQASMQAPMQTQRPAPMQAQGQTYGQLPAQVPLPAQACGQSQPQPQPQPQPQSPRPAPGQAQAQAPVSAQLQPQVSESLQTAMQAPEHVSVQGSLPGPGLAYGPSAQGLRAYGVAINAANTANVNTANDNATIANPVNPVNANQAFNAANSAYIAASSAMRTVTPEQMAQMAQVAPYQAASSNGVNQPAGMQNAQAVPYVTAAPAMHNRPPVRATSQAQRVASAQGQMPASGMLHMQQPSQPQLNAQAQAQLQSNMQAQAPAFAQAQRPTQIPSMGTGHVPTQVSAQVQAQAQAQMQDKSQIQGHSQVQSQVQPQNQGSALGSNVPASALSQGQALVYPSCVPDGTPVPGNGVNVEPYPNQFNGQYAAWSQDSMQQSRRNLAAASMVLGSPVEAVNPGQMQAQVQAAAPVQAPASSQVQTVAQGPAMALAQAQGQTREQRRAQIQPQSQLQTQPQSRPQPQYQASAQVRTQVTAQGKPTVQGRLIKFEMPGIYFDSEIVPPSNSGAVSGSVPGSVSGSVANSTPAAVKNLGPGSKPISGYILEGRVDNRFENRNQASSSSKLTGIGQGRHIPGQNLGQVLGQSATAQGPAAFMPNAFRPERDMSQTMLNGGRVNSGNRGYDSNGFNGGNEFNGGMSLGSAQNLAPAAAYTSGVQPGLAQASGRIPAQAQISGQGQAPIKVPTQSQSQSQSLSRVQPSAQSPVIAPRNVGPQGMPAQVNAYPGSLAQRQGSRPRPVQAQMQVQPQGLARVQTQAQVSAQSPSQASVYQPYMVQGQSGAPFQSGNLPLSGQTDPGVGPDMGPGFAQSQPMRAQRPRVAATIQSQGTSQGANQGSIQGSGMVYGAPLAAQAYLEHSGGSNFRQPLGNIGAGPNQVQGQGQMQGQMQGQTQGAKGEMAQGGRYNQPRKYGAKPRTTYHNPNFQKPN